MMQGAASVDNNHTEECKEPTSYLLMTNPPDKIGLFQSLLVCREESRITAAISSLIVSGGMYCPQERITGSLIPPVKTR